MMLKNLIHYNESLEMVVLGSCMLEIDAIARIRSLINPVHFFNEDHKKVYECMCKMWDEGIQIDLLTVTHYMRHYQKINDLAYFLTRLTMSVVSTGHLETHAIILRELFIERECLKIQSHAGSGDGDAIDKLLNIQKQVNDALNLKSTDDWKSMGEVMMELIKHMENVKGKEIMGVSTGFKMLDAITFGLQPGQLIVIAARPSVGKSAFANVLAMNAAHAGSSVGIVSLEMPSVEVGGRLASLYSDKEFWRIYRNNMENEEEERMFYKKAHEIANLPIHLSDKTNVTMPDIRGKAYKLYKKNQLGFLLIDYLQLIEEGGKTSDNREREVAKISAGCKGLAKELNIPIVLLAQLNREPEKRQDKKPRLSDIRESGAIEQDADVVIILHRDWKAGIENDKNGNSTKNKATILLEKTRNGETKEIDIGFDGDKMKFYDLQNEKKFESTEKLVPDNPRAGINVNRRIEKNTDNISWGDNPF